MKVRSSLIKPLTDYQDNEIRNQKAKLANQYLFFDVETSGTVLFRHEIIEFAGVLTDSSLGLQKRYYSRFKLNNPSWDNEAEKVHRISKEELKNEADKKEFLTDLVSDLDVPIFVCHAAKVMHYFDVAFLMCELFQNEISHNLDPRLFYSTYDMAKAKGLPLENYKLDTLCNYYDIELDHHNAESDTNACYELFKELMEI